MAIKIKGLDKLAKDLRKFGADGEKALKLNIELAATNIERGAIARLKPELNFIRQRIDKRIEDGGFTAKVGVQGTEENPVPLYHEVGTGLFASQLLNGGQYDDEIRALARLYYINGEGTLPASPYLFPAYFEERPKILEELRKDLERLAKSV